MTRITIALLAAALLVSPSCGPEPSVPTAPTSPESPSPQPAPSPLPPLVTRTITGRVVDDSNAPVAGAEVRNHSAHAQTISDSTGDYVLTFEGRTSAYLQASRAGYAPAEYYVDLPGTVTTRDLRLYRNVAVSAGESVQLSIQPPGPLCGLASEFWCRRVNVRSSTAGTLVIEVDPVGAAPQPALLIGQIQYPFRATRRLEHPIGAGESVSVDVLIPWTTPSEVSFRLTTAIVSLAKQTGSDCPATEQWTYAFPDGEVRLTYTWTAALLSR